MKQFKIDKKTGLVSAESTLGVGSREYKRAKGKQLYTEKLYSAAEVARVLNVQEKTVGEWVKKGNWKALKEKVINQAITENKIKHPNPILIIEDLRAYIKENSPILAVKIDPVIDGYMKQAAKIWEH